MTTTNKPSAVFWIIAVLALIWNGMGAMAYLGQKMMTPEALDLLPEAERALYNDIPIWATSAFAIAVWGGLLGAIFMLLRKKLSKTLFLLSLLGIIVHAIYNFFISGAMDVYGATGMIMPLFVVLIGIFLVWYCKNAIGKGWLK